MHLLAWAAGGFAVLVWSVIVAVMLGGTMRIRRLDRLTLPEGAPLPRLTVVVPARNEAKTVEPAMRSLLAIDYPDLEILAVNDRSEDATGEILDRLAAEDPRLRPIHLTELPAGWLGKNNALQMAQQQARGEWILFTDADVCFAPDSLRMAVQVAEERKLDHFSLFPDLVMHGFWERLFFGFFGVMFSCYYRPWEACNPRLSGHVGMGAFNLVRAATYRAAGGHEPIRLAVVDDVALGGHMKRQGLRSDCLAAGQLVRVRWLQGLRGAIRGLAKNTFAGMGFQPFRVVLSSVTLMISTVWPALGVFVGPHSAHSLCMAALVGMMLSALSGVFGRARCPLWGLTYPVAAFFFSLTMWRSMLATYRHGGVVWRGTRYDLDELRRANL